MKRRFSVTIIILVAFTIFVSGCSRHRKTQVYGTEESADVYEEENLSYAFCFTYSGKQLEDALIDKGYTKKLFDSEVSVYQYISPGETCRFIGGWTESEIININLNIMASGFEEVISAEDIKTEYLEAVELVVTLQGDVYNEEAAISFMKESKELDGHYYALSSQVRAYSQCNGNEVTVNFSLIEDGEM